jgi:glutamine amidotransferase
MGWNELVVVRDSPLVQGVASGDYVYFVHSYYAAPGKGDLVAYTDYAGVAAAAVVSKGNLYGAQFHPEKSSKTGALILENFVGMAK